MFGSSGQIEQPLSFINTFVFRRDKYHNHFGHQKKILKIDKLLYLDIHDSKVEKKSKEIKSNNYVFKYQITSIHNSTDLLNSHNLHLNNYAIQSYDWFKKIKMTRCSASSIKNDNVRTEGYFRAYDFNDIVDDELKHKKYI